MQFVKIPKVQESIPALGQLPQLAKTLVIDYSSVAAVTLGTVNSANYVADEEKRGRTPSNDAMDEWYYQISKKFISLAGAVNPDNVIIALDSRPYWRNEYVSNYYRKTNSYYWNPFAKDEGGNALTSWVINREGTFIHALHDAEVGDWIFTNMTVALKKEMELDPDKGIFGSEWIEFDGGKLTKESSERALSIWGREIPENVYDYPAFTDLKLFESEKVSYPYKHGRKWGWGSIITKEQFVEKSTLFADMVAPFLGAKYPVAVELAEADDIVHSVCKMADGDSVMVASVDSDLKQLVAHYDNVSFISLYQGVNLVETTPARELSAFNRKILGGDTSDKIRGCRKKTVRKSDGVVTKVSNPMSDGAADKWEGQFRNKLEDAIRDNIDDASYEKNTTLVDLRKTPEDIQTNIETSLTKAEDALGAVIEQDGQERSVCLDDIRIGMLEAEIVAGEATALNAVWSGILRGDVDNEPIQPVEETVEKESTIVPDEVVVDEVQPIIEAPTGLPAEAVIAVPKLFKFIGHVAAHPTDTSFGAWDTPVIEAENPGDFIEKLKESNPESIGKFIVVSPDGIGWCWWVCPITIEDLGEV